MHIELKLSPALMLAAGMIAGPAQANNFYDFGGYDAVASGALDVTLDGAIAPQYRLSSTTDGFKNFNQFSSLEPANLITGSALPGPGLPQASDFASPITSVGLKNAPEQYYGLKYDVAGTTRYGNVHFGPGGTLISITTGTAVPEPAVWAELVTGFALAGAGLRAARRRRTVAA